MRGRVHVVRGTGAVARALAVALASAGAEVRVLSRSARRAAAARRAIVRALGKPAPKNAGAVRAGVDRARALRGADVVLLCVADHALADSADLVAAALAGLDPARAPRVALHTSGYWGEAPLAACAERGLAVGAMHPLVPLPREDRDGTPDARLRGAWFALSGDEAALAAARAIVRACRGRELGGAVRERTRYHAAAALGSNGLVALFDLALDELCASGLERDTARAALAALLRANLEHLAELEPAAALTGPVARGDAEVVGGHLATLGATPAGDAYRVLGRRLLELARAAGTLSPAADRAVGRALEPALERDGAAAPPHAGDGAVSRASAVARDDGAL